MINRLLPIKDISNIRQSPFSGVCRSAQITGVFFTMIISIVINQDFAVANELTITQVLTLSACISVLTWAKTLTGGSDVWYDCSEEVMMDEFPLLFPTSEALYNGLKELEERGFLEFRSFGKETYFKLTSKCATWYGC